MDEALIRQVRPCFEELREVLPIVYGALDWEQKSTLLKALIEARDHPPGFRVSFDIQRISPAERDYLKAIGIGPFADGETPDAR